MLLFLIGLAVTLLPVKKDKFPQGALAENLWTHKGQWSKPRTGVEPNHWGMWIRREYGIGWNWLVIDTDAVSDAWQARLDPLCLAFYVFAASIPPVGFLATTLIPSIVFCAIERMNKRRKPKSGYSAGKGGA